MDNRTRRAILERRIEMLKGHLWVRVQPEYDAPAPLSESALDKAEAELKAVEQEQPRGS
jgi:hypothetical protein